MAILAIHQLKELIIWWIQVNIIFVHLQSEAVKLELRFQEYGSRIDDLLNSQKAV